MTHRLLPYDQWVSDQDDYWQLHDPVSGEMLDPDQPPSFLLENGRLRDGNNFLRHLYSETSVGLYYSVGEATAADLGHRQFEADVQNSEFAIKALGHTIDGTIRLPERKLVMPDGFGNSYTERLDYATMATGMARFCVGLEVDEYGAPKTQTERLLSAMARTAERYHDEDGDGSVRKAVLKIISANAHQWYRTLSAGEQFGILQTELYRHSVMLDGVMLVAPVKDIDYGRKFQAAGITTVGEELAYQDSLTTDIQWDTTVMAQGRITPDLLS